MVSIRFIFQKCVKANDSVMLCNSPKLSMPSLRDESVSTSDVIDGERGIIGGYRVYIGLILDGVATYQNLLNVLPDYGELRLYHDPKFFNFTETNRLKIFRAYSESYLPIQVKAYRIYHSNDNKIQILFFIYFQCEHV